MIRSMVVHHTMTMILYYDLCLFLVLGSNLCRVTNIILKYMRYL